MLSATDSHDPCPLQEAQRRSCVSVAMAVVLPPSQPPSSHLDLLLGMPVSDSVVLEPLRVDADPREGVEMRLFSPQMTWLVC